MRPSKSCEFLLPILIGVLSSACGGGGGGGGGGTGTSAPSALAFGSPATAFLLGVPVEVRPSVQGTVTGWSIVPALPAGLALDPASGAIAGTPGATLAPTTFRVTASNAGGSTSALLEITVARAPRTAYVANAEDDGLSSYALDVGSGRLRFLQSASLPAGETRPSDVLVHPELPVAYVLTRGDALSAPTVATFALAGPDGAAGHVSSVPAPAQPVALRLAPAGDRLYALGAQPPLLATYAIDAADGSLSALGAPVATDASPTALALAPGGRFAWVASADSATVQTFELDAAGLPGAVGTPLFLNAARPADLAVDPQGRFLFASMANFPFLLSLVVDPASGALAVAASTAAGGSGTRLAAHPSGRFLHAARPQDDTLLSFRVGPADGKLTSSGSAPVPGRPVAVGFDEAGLHAWVLADDAREVGTYRVALDSGAPVLEGSVRTRGVPSGADLLLGQGPYRRVPRLLFAANQDDGTLSTYRVEGGGAQLVEVGPPVPTGGAPVDLVVDPRGRFLFVVEGDVPQVETFAVDLASAGLTPVGAPTPLGGQPVSALVEGASRYLFVASRLSDRIAAFEIQESGELVATALQAVGAAPRRLALGATERYLYVASATGGGSLRGFGIGGGAFQAGPPAISTSGLPLGLAFSTSGARSFVPSASPDQVVPYAVGAASGQLVPSVPPTPIAQALSDAIVHPGDGYVLVATGGGAGPGSVRALRVNASTGGLQPSGEAPAGLGPRRLVVTPDGRYVYVANQEGDDLTVLAFDPAGGGLAPLAQVPAGDGPVALALLCQVE